MHVLPERYRLFKVINIYQMIECRRKITAITTILLVGRRRKDNVWFLLSDGENVAVQSRPGFIDGVRDSLRPGIIKPLRLIVVYFFFYHAASLSAMRPFMIEVFTRLEVPISPNVLTVSAHVLLIILIYVRKKKIN